MPHALAVPLRAERLGDAAAYRAAAHLYARVFGYEDRDLSINPHLLSALVRNGGSAVGVFTPADELIGFAYGFSARDAAGRDFHYSQAAVVDPRHQGQGVGRMLKDCQRRIALEWGHDTMRWTFDPLLTRNAHFNFSSLGAEGIAFTPDYYDRPATDRLVVEWALRRGHDPYAALRGLEPPVFARADWGRIEDVSAAGPTGPVEVRWLPLATEPRGDADSLRVALTSMLDGEHVLVACRRLSADTAAYLAVRSARATGEGVEPS